MGSKKAFEHYQGLSYSHLKKTFLPVDFSKVSLLAIFKSRMGFPNAFEKLLGVIIATFKRVQGFSRRF